MLSSPPPRSGGWKKTAGLVAVGGMLGFLGWVGYKQLPEKDAAAGPETVADGGNGTDAFEEFDPNAPVLDADADASQPFSAPIGSEASNPFAARATEEAVARSAKPALRPVPAAAEEEPPANNPFARFSRAPDDSADDSADAETGEDEASVATASRHPAFGKPEEDEVEAAAPARFERRPVQTAELEDVAGAEEAAEESDPFSATAEAARSEEAVTVVKAAPNRPASTVPPSLDDTGDWSAVDTAEATEVEQTAAEETEAAPQVEQVQAEFEFGGEPEETSALETETPALTVPAPGEPEEFQFEDASPVRPAPTFPKAIPAEEPNAFSAPFEPGSIEPVVATRDPSDEKVHIVQSGETFWTIARHHYSAGRYFQALAEYNKPRIADARQLKPGMKVLVPSAETLEKQFSRQIGTAAPAAAAVKARAGLSYDAAGQALYRVGSKDTLSSIAQKHLGRSSRWTEIQQLNADTLKDPAALKPGMILKMPDDASQVREASSIPSDR